MPSSNPYKPIVDMIDTLIRKDYATQDSSFYIHITELPFLPQNILGCKELENFLKKMKIKIVNQSAGNYQIRKLKEEEKLRLTTEKRTLENVGPENTTDKAITLETSRVIFNDDKALIEVGSKISSLPPFKNEHDFCRVMFRYKVGEPIDWSLIFQLISGSPETIGDESDRRMVQDTMYAINNRIKKDFNTKDSLFSWENKSIRRNF